MTERTSIQRLTEKVEDINGKVLNIGDVVYKDTLGLHQINENTPVSMNLFGFTPDYFDYSKKLFVEFLSNSGNISNLKSEFFIPSAVNNFISSGKAEMKVLSSSAKWFGVTYKEDRPEVILKIKNLIEEGSYPEKLWE